jgi:hypothetical protein
VGLSEYHLLEKELNLCESTQSLRAKLGQDMLEKKDLRLYLRWAWSKIQQQTQSALSHGLGEHAKAITAAAGPRSKKSNSIQISMHRIDKKRAMPSRMCTYKTADV